MILGFNHDAINGQSATAPITLGMKHLLSTPMPIHDSQDTYSSSFSATTLNTNELKGRLYNSMSSKWKTMIKTVNKKFALRNKTVTDYPSKLFLLSNTEFAREKSSYQYIEDGKQYSYYVTNYKNIKILANGTGDSAYWWTRSPSKESNYEWIGRKNQSGTTITYIPISIKQYKNFGICLNFCI